LTTVLTGVRSEKIGGLWPRIRPFVDRALSHAGGRYAPADVLAALLRAQMQLWVAIGGDGDDGIEAVLVTEIIDYPRRRRCNLFLSAGNALEACLEHLPTIETWARAQGCDAIEASGRPGWERVLPGFRRTHVMLEKDLSLVGDQS
jgi:hypothetical protein